MSRMTLIRMDDSGPRRFAPEGRLPWSLFLTALAVALPAVEVLAQAPDERVEGNTSAQTEVSADAGSFREAAPALDESDRAEDPAGPEGVGPRGVDADGTPSEPNSPLAEPPATRLETLLDFNRLAEEERYEEALPLGEALLKLTEAEFGSDSLETAEAYEAVARVQTKAEEHELSEQNFLHAVALIRSADGTFSELAIDPLIGLGDNYHVAGQYLNAITAYNEARTINRRVYGLLNEAQIPILNRVTESFQGLEQYQEADEQQLTILHLAERNHPEGSPEFLEAIYDYAGWLRETGRYHEERAQYSRVQRIIRDQHGKESVLLVRSLREIGNSFRHQRIPEGQGISALRSALEILEMSGQDHPLAEAEVLRDLGDWEVAFSRMDPDLTPYRLAWQLLGEVDNGEDLREQWFGQLENVLGEPVSQRGLSNDPEAPSGHVIVQFDVDRFGRSQNVSVASSDPPGLKDEAVARAVRRWRFRPFMVDGEIVEKERLALQFNYRYLPDELE